MRECALCGEDFVSLGAFDEHMIGKPADRRRGCLSAETMLSKGWARNARGSWASPRAQLRAQAARERFGH